MTLTTRIGGAVAAAALGLLLGLETSTLPTRAIPRWPSHARSSRWPKSFSEERFNSLPEVVFWAWERREDLQFLRPNTAGVAFLAKTIFLSLSADNENGEGTILSVRPRLQPLRFSPGTPLVAVVRIETRLGHRLPNPEPTAGVSSAMSSYSSRQTERIAREIASVQNLPAIRAIQVDFDATQSELPFYIELLKHLRGKLPASFPVSITALASWCIGDPWLEQLPPGTIQEAVPMLFRMGPDAPNVAKFLHSGQDFPVSACQTSLGLSTDEFLSTSVLDGKLTGVPRSRRLRRIYVFAPRAWTPSEASAVLREWQP